MELLHSSGVDPGHPRHMHESFAIGLVEAGVVVNQSRGETSYLPAGSIYTFNPGEVHSGYAGRGRTVSHRSFYPSEAAVLEFAQASGLKGTPFFCATSVAQPKLAAQLRYLHDLLKRSDHLLERQSATAEVFGALLSGYTSLKSSRTEGREPKAVSTVRSYLDAHFDENVSLGDLSALVGLNRAYLLRTFRRAVGVPPHSYLIHCRLERAKELLRAGEPAAQVALSVGFSDQSHLNLHFKRQLNVSPGRYAKSHFLPRKSL